MPRTVLIVDDERDVNDILASLVKARDFEAVQRFEGATVIDDVRTLQPDLVLLDLMLPDSDGFAICEKLKRTRETNLTPVVMVTSLNDPDHRLTGVRVGANGYLTKPFTPRQLFDSIDAALAWREEHLSTRGPPARSTSTSGANWRISSKPTTCSPTCSTTLP